MCVCVCVVCVCVCVRVQHAFCGGHGASSGSGKYIQVQVWYSCFRVGCKTVGFRYSAYQSFGPMKFNVANENTHT